MNPPPISDCTVAGSCAPVAAGRWSRIRSEIRKRLVDDGLEKLNLRWRFRVVVLAFGLPFLGYIVWSATEQAAIEKAHASDRARAHAALIAARVEDYAEHIDQLLGSAAQAIGAHLGDADALTLQLQNMRSHLPRSISNVGVWSLNGTSIGALDRRLLVKNVNVSDRHYFQDALARQDLAIEGPLQSRATGDYVLQFARPILDAGGRPVAVVTMSSRLVDLVAQLDRDGKVSDGALVTIVDRNGVIVSRSVDAAYWIGKQIPQPERVKGAFARRAGASEQIGVDGQLRLSGYSVADKLPWLIIVGEPIEVAIAPVSDRLLKGLGLGLVIFAIAMFIAGRTGAWTLRPVMRLAIDADLLGGGDLAHRSSVVSGGEIATLAANFNRMAEALQERDRALAASQMQLRAITDNIPEQITYIDRDERYRFVNAYQGPLPTLQSSNIIGMTVREVRGDEVYANCVKQLHDALAGTATVFEASARFNGADVHYRCTYVPDRDPTGAILGVYAFTENITERKIAELRRTESERRLVTITDNLPALVCYVDRNRRYRFLNKAFEKWYRLPLEQIINQPFNMFMSADVAAQYDHYFQRGIAGEHCQYELEIPGFSHGPRWLRCNFIPDFDESGTHVRGLYGMLHDVTAAKEAERRLTRLAQYDTLTGLANRLQFNELLATALAEPGEERMALMFLDIDHFKQVNDRFGHPAGDALLKEFSLRLTESVRPTDAVARLSGDEFVVLLKGMHSDEEPQFIARKIIAAVQKSFTIEDHFIQVGTSIGIAMREPEGETPSTLMKRADEALYEAKRGGRNTFRLAS